eukprot:5403477-Pleurochrysis_carterae.AAC.1
MYGDEDDMSVRTPTTASTDCKKRKFVTSLSPTCTVTKSSSMARTTVARCSWSSTYGLARRS